LLIFISPAQASHPIEPARASLPHCLVCPTEPDVVTLSSSGTEEALELLFLGTLAILFLAFQNPPTAPAAINLMIGLKLMTKWLVFTLP
jgi:hypothetical protein